MHLCNLFLKTAEHFLFPFFSFKFCPPQFIMVVTSRFMTAFSLCLFRRSRRGGKIVLQINPLANRIRQCFRKRILKQHPRFSNTSLYNGFTGSRGRYKAVEVHRSLESSKWASFLSGVTCELLQQVSSFDIYRRPV